MKKHDGGPAFPSDGAADAVSYWGMSLRDYFAGQALHAGADAVCDELSEPGRDGIAHAERHARAAYLIADAMLAERDRPSPEFVAANVDERDNPHSFDPRD
jgi:hypothetical protein